MVLIRARLDTARLAQLGHASREQPAQLWRGSQAAAAAVVGVAVASCAVPPRPGRRKAWHGGRPAHAGDGWCPHGRCTGPVAHFAHNWRRTVVDLCDFPQPGALADVSQQRSL